jgi:hypothetical protein
MPGNVLRSMTIELNFPNPVRERRDLFGRDSEIGLALQALYARSRQTIRS